MSRVIVTLKEPIVFNDVPVRVVTFDKSVTDEATPSGVLEFKNQCEYPVFIPIHNILGMTYKTDENATTEQTVAINGRCNG